MTNISRNRATTFLLVLLCSVSALSSIWQVREWGDRLSRVDVFSEANMLREIRNFQDEGLTKHQGLGTVYRDGMYPGIGFVGDPDDRIHGVTPDGVYTHYPPGPEYLLYAATKILGSEPVSRLRLLPICVGWAALAFLGLAVRRRFGAGVAWPAMAACVLSPAVTDGFVGLHYQGYAMALLMVEIGLAIGCRPAAVPYAVIGFIQGWLSFDYVFLVTFVPLAIELAMPRIDPGYRPRWKHAFIAAFLAGGGFTAALSLHFVQVAAFWGAFGLAVGDFAHAAAHRAGADMVSGPVGFLTQALGNLKVYLYGVHPFNAALTLPETTDPAEWSMFRFLGLSLGPWWLLVTAGLMAGGIRKAGGELKSLRLNWHSVCGIGLAVSCSWYVVMVNHGAMHRHFIYRHMFFMFFLMTLFASAAVHRHWIQARLDRGGRYVGEAEAGRTGDVQAAR